MSHVTCHGHMSHVACHIYFFGQSVKLVGGGSVINRATSSIMNGIEWYYIDIVIDDFGW